MTAPDTRLPDLGAPERRPRAAPAVAVASVLLPLAVVLTSAVLSGRGGQVDRDQSVYVYGGQRLADGVAPYVSIFDPKGPLAFVVSGAGIALARLVGAGDVTGSRMVFAVVSLAATGAVLLVARTVWAGPWPGAAAALCFATYGAWRVETLAGPDPKQLLVLCWMLSVWALLRRRWLIAGVTGALAVATWQPIVLTVVVLWVVGVARAGADGADGAGGTAPAGRPRVPPRRARAALTVVGGAGAVAAALGLWLGLAGALPDALDATVSFPLRGIEHAAATPGERLTALRHVLVHDYGVGGVVLVVGSVALLAIAAVRLVRPDADSAEGGWRVRASDPVVGLLLPCLLVPLAYSFVDFQGAPDLFPLLPASSFGVAGMVAAVSTRSTRSTRSVRASAVGLVAVVGVAALGIATAQAAAYDPKATLADQRAWVCTLRTVLAASEPGRTPDGLWVLGDATPLVLTGTVNPDRFIYDASGEYQWRLPDDPDPIGTWEAQVAAADPAVVLIARLAGPVPASFEAYFRGRGYTLRHVGVWTLLLRTPPRAGASRPGCAPLRGRS